VRKLEISLSNDERFVVLDWLSKQFYVRHLMISSYSLEIVSIQRVISDD